MKKLLLVATVAAFASQYAFGVNANTVRACQKGYIYNSATGKCSPALYGNYGPGGQKTIGTGGQRHIGNGGTQRVAPMKAHVNTIGGNSATWTPAMNTQGGKQKQNIGSNGKQSLKSGKAAMRKYCTKKGYTYVPVDKGVGYCSMKTAGGVRKQSNIGGNSNTWSPTALGRNGAGTQQLPGSNPATYTPKAVVGRNGAGTQQLPGSNPATWAPRMTGNKAGGSI